MRFGLLGSLEVLGDDDAPLEVGGPQPRAVLAALLAAEGRVVPVDALVDLIWGETPPASWAGTLQTYVSRLRRALEPGRGSRDRARVLLSEAPGYRLAVDAEAVDFRRFERLADDGRAALAAGRPEVAVELFAQAEALWRGPALAEHLHAGFAIGLAARLEERRRVVVEQRLEAELALGRPGAVAADAAEAVRAEPMRERLWALYALALYRSDRQADALRALGAARRTMVEELGIEPGRPLKELEAAILAHDPALDLVAAPAPAAPPAPTSTAAAPGLVGRAQELGSLRTALGEASGGARFALVVGEPGIGKTTLVEALVHDAERQGAFVAWGRAYEGGQAPSFWPWLEVLRGIAALPSLAGEGVAQLLEPSAVEPGGSTAGSFRRFGAVAEVLGRAGRDAPLVVVLDDLQWADPDSLGLLTFLAGCLRDERVLVLGTLREGEIDSSAELVDVLAAVARRPTSRRLTLRGLSADEVAELLRSASGPDVPTSAVSAISERSEGNPFFVRELARLIGEDGSVPPSVPTAVGDVLRQRVGRLPDPTVELLGVAAVLGREVELDLLAAAADRPLGQVLDELEPAVDAALLVEGTGGAPLRFAHALVREALVDQLGGLRRQRLHLRVADALVARHGDRDDVAEQVAEHLWAAAPLGVAARAAAALERAGQVATRRHALASAARSLDRAVALHLAAGAEQDELRTLMRLMGVRRLLGDYAGAATAYERATERARRLGREADLVELLWAEWGVHSILGAYDRSRHFAEQLAAVAEASDDPQLRFAGHTVTGLRCWDDGHIAEMRSHLEAAEALSPALPATADTTSGLGYQRMMASAFLAHALAVTGDADASEERFATLCDRAADPYLRATASVVRAVTLLAVGRMDELERAARTGLDADPDGQFVLWNANLRLQLGVALLHGGDRAAGRASFEEGRASYGRLGARTGLAAILAGAGMAALTAAHVDEAEELVRDARDELDATGQGWTEPLVLLAEAHLAAARGCAGAEVADRFTRAEAVARAQGATAVAERIARESAQPLHQAAQVPPPE